MKKTKDHREKNRTYRCAMRLSQEEYNLLKAKLSASTSRKMSDYIRKALFDKPITVKYRNESLDKFMEELILLRGDLNSLGNNFNQVVKKLNSIQLSGEYKFWLKAADNQQAQLLEKIAGIQKRIDEFTEIWLQK